MLFFPANEVKAQPAGERVRCWVCEKNIGTWWGPANCKARQRILCCAHCLLYRPESRWGYENRHEILHIGRFCQNVAAEYGNTGPALDARGRLCPEDAERLVLGVSVTSKLIARQSPLYRGHMFEGGDE